MKLFQGTYTAVITPFNDKDEVDYNVFEKIIEQQIAGGVEGIVFAGTTGESPTLSPEEHIEILQWAGKVINGRCQLIAGTGSNSTKEALEYSQVADKAGADGLLIVTPYYNKPTQAGMIQHFKTIADSVNTPIIIYNIKGRTGVNLETSTLIELSKHKNIQGVKEASGDIFQMMDVIHQTPDNFSVLVGDDSLTLPFVAAGGDGVVSVVSNYIPKTFSHFTRQCLSGNFDQARDTHYQLLDLMNASFIETNPIPAKEIMAMLYGRTPCLRLPLCRASAESMDIIKKAAQFVREIEPHKDYK